MKSPPLAGLGLLLPHAPVAEVYADVGDLAVDGHAVVVEAGRLQDDAGRAHEDGQREYPEEEAVQHHRHVLPVLLHLKRERQQVERGTNIPDKLRESVVSVEKPTPLHAV